MATPYPGNVTPVAQASQDSVARPVIRTIQLSDLHEALRLGWEDFKAVPSHAIILCVIYPVLGLVLARTVLGYSVLPLLFPLIVDRRFGIRIGKMSLRANKIARLRARTSWRLDGFVASAFAR
jgi:uncharacterized membrane protein